MREELITNRQVKRMVLLETVAAGGIFGPVLAVNGLTFMRDVNSEETFRSLVIGILGLLMAYVYGRFMIWVSGRRALLIKRESMEEASSEGDEKARREQTGGILARIGYFIYALRYGVRAVFTLVVIVLLVREFLLGDMGYLFVVIPALVVCFYACHVSIRGRAKLLELLFWWTLLPLCLSFLLSISGWKPELLMRQEFWLQRHEYVLLWMYLMLFLPLENMVFYMPETQSGREPHRPDQHDSKQDDGRAKKKSVTTCAHQGLVQGLLINLALFVMTYLTVGEAGLRGELFGTVSMLQFVETPGRIVSRLDILAMPFVLLGLFIVWSGYVFYALVSFQRMGNRQNVIKTQRASLNGHVAKWMFSEKGIWCLATAFLLVVIAAVAGVVVSKGEDMKWWLKAFVEYSFWIDVPLSILLPVLSVIRKPKRKEQDMEKGGSKMERTDSRKKMRHIKQFLMIVMGLGLVSVTGCARVNIEDGDYVLMMGIEEANDEQYTMHVAMADMQGYKAEEGQSVKMKGASQNTDSISSFQQEYGRTHATEMDFGHVKLLLIQQDILEDKEKLTGLLLQIKEEKLIQATVLVAATKEATGKYIELDEKQDVVVSRSLEEMLRKQEAGHATLNDLYFALWEDQPAMVPLLTLSEEKNGLPYIVEYMRVE